MKVRVIRGKSRALRVSVVQVQHIIQIKGRKEGENPVWDSDKLKVFQTVFSHNSSETKVSFFLAKNASKFVL